MYIAKRGKRKQITKQEFNKWRGEYKRIKKRKVIEEMFKEILIVSKESGWAERTDDMLSGPSLCIGAIYELHKSSGMQDISVICTLF